MVFIRPYYRLKCAAVALISLATLCFASVGKLPAQPIATNDPVPAFHGPRVFGVRPNTPFFQPLSFSGARPIHWAVYHLPPGLHFDAQSGIITGALTKPGKYDFQAEAHNGSGRAVASYSILCGEKLALSPPMGWNSYDAFGDSVTEAEVLANAKWMKDTLQPFGWDTVVVDFRWYDSLANGVRVQDPEGVTIDSFGRCVPAPNRFPSAGGGAGFKPLADKLHAMGLKFGIHIMRGIARRAVEQNLPIEGSTFRAGDAIRAESDPNRECIWNRDMFGVNAATEAGRAWYASLARQYSDWGVDYIKCDDIANMQRGEYYAADEIEALSSAFRHGGRSIILSLSPGESPLNCGPHLKEFANLWRVSGDFWDNWPSLNHNFDLLAEWSRDTGPGTWPDGDMIPLGHICQRNCDVHPDRWTRFTPDEQVTLMSLLAIAPSPLMLGMNLPDNDAWTTSLLTNPEVLAVNQDPLGAAGRRMSGPPMTAETWMKRLSDGSFAVGVFNRSTNVAQVRFPWKNLGFESPPAVRDLWRHDDVPTSGTFAVDLAPHACVLLKVK